MLTSTYIMIGHSMEHTTNKFRQLQQFIADKLNDSAYFKDRGVKVLVEQTLDIDFQIQTAMNKQGVCPIVMFEKADFQGNLDKRSQAWAVQPVIQVVENPSIWRAWLKKNGFTDGTGLDLAAEAAKVLADPSSDTYGMFVCQSIETGEDANLIVSKATFSTIIQ